MVVLNYGGDRTVIVGLIVMLKWMGVHPANILDSMPQSTRHYHMPLHRIKRENNQDSRPMHRSRYALSGSPTDPLFPGLGTHYAYIYVGTDIPQRMSVIIDTGSYRTAFPCNPCTDCGDYENYHESGPFEPTQSLTYGSTGKREDQRYSEGDGWSGVESFDQSYIGAATNEEYPQASEYAVNFQFYCQDMINGLFIEQYADGIMGMAISSSSAVPQLVEGGVIENNAFGLCFAADGGTMTLGGAAGHLWKTPHMQYAALKAHSNLFYGVTLRDILIGSSADIVDASVGGNYGSEGNYILDSGTTLTYLPVSLMAQFVSKWEEVTGITFDTEEPMTEWGDFTGFPDITFMFKADEKNSDNVAYIFHPENYLEKYCPVATRCFGYMSILFEGSMPILGANFLQGHDVLFDTDNTRIGFVEADCEWTGPTPSSSPTVTPAPTISFAPTSSPTKKEVNNSLVQVELAIVLFIISCCIGVSFAAACNSLRKFRKEQAIARASYSGSGAYDAGEEGFKGRVCRMTAWVVDRCKCCPQSHQFDRLGDEDGMELPEQFSDGLDDENVGNATSDKKGLKSIAKSSIAHANRFLKRKDEFERPGEGLEF